MLRLSVRTHTHEVSIGGKDRAAVKLVQMKGLAQEHLDMMSKCSNGHKINAVAR
jgi:hypothetical protein